MYIKIFFLVKIPFFLEGIQQSSLIIKKENKQSTAGILMKTVKNVVLIASSLWIRF